MFVLLEAVKFVKFYLRMLSNFRHLWHIISLNKKWDIHSYSISSLTIAVLYMYMYVCMFITVYKPKNNIKQYAHVITYQ